MTNKEAKEKLYMQMDIYQFWKGDSIQKARIMDDTTNKKRTKSIS